MIDREVAEKKLQFERDMKAVEAFEKDKQLLAESQFKEKQLQMERELKERELQLSEKSKLMEFAEKR